MENMGNNSIWSTIRKSCRRGTSPLAPKNLKMNNLSYFNSTASLLDKDRQIMGHCGGFSFTCPSQTQDPLANQGKRITCLGSLRLDQDKIHLTPEVRSFHSSTISYGIDRQSRLGLSDGQINLIKSLGFLTCIVNHAWCLSDGLDA